MSLRVVGIIQARMGSTRLPGKVLRNLAGKPMLLRVVQRTCRARRLNEIVVATTTSQKDDSIVDLCRANDWPSFRGSESDVLDRYLEAARTYDADAVARITSDCPLIDPEIIDEAVRVFICGQWDYVSNILEPRTYPRGLDVEILTIAALERAWKEDGNPAWREHVTPYISRHPQRFRLHGLVNDRDYSYMRWTVDTPADLEFMRKIFDHFGNDRFGWKDVLHLLDARPEWLQINQDIQQKALE